MTCSHSQVGSIGLASTLTVRSARKLCFIAFVTLFVFEAFGGVFRYLTATLPLIAYVPKAIAALSIAFSICVYVARFRSIPSVVVVAGTFFAGFAGLSLSNSISFAQSAFAVWTYVPFLFLLIYSDDVIEGLNSTKATRTALIIFAVTILGVLLTTFWRAPWIGFVVDVGSTSIESARDWTTFDRFRPPGFTRVSVIAGLAICLSGVYLLKSSLRFSHKLIVWCTGLLGIYLTTSAAALVAYFAIPVVFSSLVPKYVRATVFGVFFLLSFSPFFATDGATLEPLLSGDDDRLTSVYMRFANTWPDTLALYRAVSDNYYLGRGLGGIGSAERVFGVLGAEKKPFEYLIDLSVADNNALYLFVQFGLVGILIHIGLWVVCFKLLFARTVRFVTIGALLAAVLVVGLVTDVMESVLCLLIVGCSIAAISIRPQHSDSR